jgi:hypothetical protein
MYSSSPGIHGQISGFLVSAKVDPDKEAFRDAVALKKGAFGATLIDRQSHA